jgi:hypothetical protein
MKQGLENQNVFFSIERFSKVHRIYETRKNLSTDKKGFPKIIEAE